MKFKPVYLLLALAVSMNINATTADAAEKTNVLVIDSGSDFTHNALKPLAFANEAEVNGKAGVDDDNNGYVDDIYGWNFVNNDKTLVNLKDTPPEYDKVLRCMELLGKLQAYGQAGMDPAEFEFLKTQYQNQKFWAWVSFTGGWAHGTHCAGITSTKNSDVNLNAITHIPTGNGPKEEIEEAMAMLKHNMAHRSTRRTRDEEPAAKKVTLDELGKYFTQLGEDYAAKVQPKADYIGSLQPRVINCSFGSPNSALVDLMKKNMPQWGWVNPTDAELQEVVNLFVTKAFLPRDKAMFAKAPNALVVIASGNSSEDLDPFVSTPNDVPIENKLVIAATDEDQKLAPFSCYGKKVVDVGVPGVNIYSTYPNQKMGYMSGTSMACPLAVNYAAQVFSVNPSLTPVQVKKILMETVDKKEWLTDKVKSGGVINVTRAVHAAQLIKDGKSLAAAITSARKDVGDKAHRSAKRTRPDLNDPLVKALYFSVIK